MSAVINNFSFGNTNIGSTTSATVGVVTKGSARFLHNYGTNNTFMGLNSGNFTLTSQNCVCIGDNTGTALTSGNNNTIIGNGAGVLLADGFSNILIGVNAGASFTSAGSNLVIGNFALDADGGTSGNNVVIGHGASGNSYSVQSIILGPGTAVNVNTESCVAIGYLAMGQTFVLVETVNSCVAIGEQSLHRIRAGGNANTAVGAFTGPNITSGTQNSLFGVNAGAGLTTGSNHVAIGADAMLDTSTTTNPNTCVGYRAGRSLTSGTGGNTFLGPSAAEGAIGSSTINTTIAIGFQCIFNGRTGSGCTYIGNGVANTNANIGTNNIGIGNSALSAINGALGATNCLCIGVSAGDNITSGAGNLFLGNNSGGAVATGANNICIGLNSGSALAAADTNYIIIGNNVAGVSGIATTATFIANIHGITTFAAAIPVLVDANGQLGTVSSTERKKENIVPLNTTIDVLDVINKLNPVQYNLKKDKKKTPTIGFTAERTHEVYNMLTYYNRSKRTGELRPSALNSHLIPFLNTAGIQELYKKMDNEFERLREENTKLENRIFELETTISSF